jgi:hypothetical protein
VGEFVFGNQFVQETGSGDGLCDHDSRIVQAAITADTVFGPFKMPPGTRGIIIWADADVVSNNTDTWQIRIVDYRPHDNLFRPIHNPGSQSTEGAKSFIIGPAYDKGLGSVTATVTGNLPRPFWIQLELLSASSWAGSLSWAAF